MSIYEDNTAAIAGGAITLFVSAQLVSNMLHEIAGHFLESHMFWCWRS